MAKTKEYFKEYINTLRIARNGAWGLFLIALLSFLIELYYGLAGKLSYYDIIVFGLMLFISGKIIQGSMTRLYIEKRRYNLK